MSESRDIDLLADIVRLLAKHGPEPFEALAQRLREGRFLNDLLALLEASSQVGRRSSRLLGSKTKSKRVSGGLDEILKQCEAENPDKARALRQLHEKLVSKKLLPTLRDIRHFAEDNGLPAISAKARDKAILPLIRAMISVPVERMTSLIARGSQLEEKGGRTLEGWADVILSKRDRGSREEK